MQQDKFIKLSRATAILGLVNGVIYSLIAIGWTLFMVNELINPSVMGIMILFLPVALILGVLGGLLVGVSIKLLTAIKNNDLARIRSLISVHIVYGSISFAVSLIIMTVVPIAYFVVVLMAHSAGNKLFSNSTTKVV